VTRYTVTWTPEAQAKLALLWSACGPTLRAAVTRSADAIDRELAADPVAKCQSREGLYTYDDPPLRAYCTVSEPDRIVCVSDLALIK
jgi:hypothetical protein